MSKLHFRFIYLIFLLLSFSSKAQVNLDSLWGVWNNNTQPDTNRLKAMKDIAWDGYLFSQPDSAFYFAQIEYDFAEAVDNKKWMADALNIQGISFAIRSNNEKAMEYYSKSLAIRKGIGDKKGIASSCNNIGNIYNSQGDYEKALEYYSKSLAIDKELDNKKSIGNIFGNIGRIYLEQGNYEKALEYFSKNLGIKKELGDKRGIASSYNNIGNIYLEQGNYEKAFEYYSKILAIEKELGKTINVANSYNNIGLIYYAQGNYEKALEYYSKSLAIKKEIGYKLGIGASYNNIGLIYKIQSNYEKALEYYSKYLEISKEIGDKNGMGLSYLNIGLVWEGQGNYEKALDYLLKSKNIKQEINTIQNLDETSAALSHIYKKLGKYKQALEMHELYMETKDSIAKVDAEEELYKFEVDKEYELKKQADSIFHADEIIIQQAENRAKEEQLKSEKQRRTGLLVIVGLVLVSLGFVFVQLRKTRAQKVVIENQHQNLNESHREITDSINYAKCIQDALMTSAVYIKDVLPESFILFNPKDVVSGDFYWVYRSPKGQIYFTVSDCTGHGVPGAFMSMIGTSLLNEFIIENNLEDTAEILTKMREQIIKSLDQKGLQGENKDGMDMALCKYDPKKGTVQYSGAYNPLIHISKNEINQLKGDSQPVGLHTGKKLPFTNKEIQVAKGDMLYIYSDGFPDQFG
ncbi:MAG: tetratricopeptide repeat protein, partial [Flavobacteriales bacterium]|nr:tetratricopeptide repeat protein [Flavobacteriales bacterium]